MSDSPDGGFDAFLEGVLPGAEPKPPPRRRDEDDGPLSTTPWTSAAPFPDTVVSPASLDGTPAPDPLTAGAEAIVPAGNTLDTVTIRLTWASLQMAITWLAVYVVMALTLPRLEPADGPLAWLPMRDVAALSSIVLSLLVFVLARQGRIPQRLSVPVATGYFLVEAIFVALAEQWGPWPTAILPPTISWVCLWMTLYPMVVPMPGRWMVPASVLAALSVPSAVLAGVVLRGNPMPATSVLVWVSFAPALCVLLAAYPAEHIHRIEEEVKRIRELGAYRLVERIAQGGMGEVWRVEHRRLARPAAMKLIREDILSRARDEDRRALLERFEREARITASLQSPHTVQLYDFGVTESGDLYYVMELLQGEDLEDLVEREGPLAPERAVSLLVQACRSLAEAHARGLVHRDIKAGNLLCCTYGGREDFVKVLDFGLVRVGEASEEAKLTRENTAIGTPDTMAPEVIRGRQDIDGRVDVYALGCVAYQLLTGTPVFRGATPTAVIAAHVEETPERPSERLGRALPEALEATVLACLAKDPADRPGDADALRERLEAAL